MKRTILNQEELNRRANEVFLLNEDDEIYDCVIDDKQEVHISMGEIGTKEEGFKWVYFDYKPDMSERPQALAYLLGESDNYND